VRPGANPVEGPHMRVTTGRAAIHPARARQL